MSLSSQNTALSSGTLAAVDLGSNSFHMIVTRLADGNIQVVDRLREMVRLRAGLNKHRKLSQEAQQRALECLQRFAQRLENIPPQNIRIVGTNTLRSAKNASNFLARAQEILGNPIQVISGIEEARLIYLGVAHSLAENGMCRLVMDIGGGSTEIVIGKTFSPVLMESLPTGCVSMTQKFFNSGRIDRKHLNKANLAARLELEGIAHLFKHHGWDNAVGSSGTVRSIAKVVRAQGWSSGGITRRALKQLRKYLLDVGETDNIRLDGLGDDRRPVFVGGFAILEALFEILGLDEIDVSDGAVREGLIYDLAGKITHEDIREQTIRHLMDKYLVQPHHAHNVEATAQMIFEKVAHDWALQNDDDLSLLKWAARLHEIGLAIAHGDYHHHGAYLVKNSDLPGFSVQEQQFLALLIKTHRQKLMADAFTVLSDELVQPAIRLCIILRLAVILHRSHSDRALPDIKISAHEQTLEIVFPDDWLAGHALTCADLKKEIKQIKSTGYQLNARDANVSR